MNETIYTALNFSLGSQRPSVRPKGDGETRDLLCDIHYALGAVAIEIRWRILPGA
jgi:hypothetical protein